MADTTLVAGSQSNNTGRILHAGAVTENFSNLTLADNGHGEENKVYLAVSPNESGNIGTAKALSGGVFAGQEAGEYVAKIIGDRIAQTDDTTLRSGSSEYNGNRGIHWGEGQESYGVDVWDYVTGTPTYNSIRGSGYDYYDAQNSADITTEPRPTIDLPGELQYMDGDVVPTLDDYKPQYEG